MATTYNGTVERIDTRLFDATIKGFRDAITQYRECREAVFQSTDKLVRTWKGEGEEAFEKAYNQLKMRLKDEEDNLRSMAENLEDMRQTYREWDEGVAKQFSEN